MTAVLNNYRILLADPDFHLAGVMKTMLYHMGFTNVHLATNDQEALRMIQEHPFDFIITEWVTRRLNGANLINLIRRSQASPKQTLPIIMMTGRAETPDVINARDLGVDEYLVKPFNAKTLFKRLESLIEQPRAFIVSSQFVGPDRRHRSLPANERRRVRVVPHKRIIQTATPPRSPQIWLPDDSLKKKLGNNKLDALITPEILEKAQAKLDALSDESLSWIREDFALLKQHFQALQNAANPQAAIEGLCELSLSINARAGTFGYARASEIAYLLYLFCRNHLAAGNAQHYLVVRKHIEVLQVILGHRIRGDGGVVGKQIISELRSLIKIYT